MNRTIHKIWLRSFAAAGLLGTSLALAGQPSTYTVPVPEALVEYATFYIPEAKLRVRDGEVKMEYVLPKALTGSETITVHAEGPQVEPGQPMVLEGELGDMVCKVSGDLGTCHINYNPQTLPVLSPSGKEKVAAYLQQTITDPTELTNRLEVLNVFYHEAAGDCHNVPVRIRKR